MLSAKVIDIPIIDLKLLSSKNFLVNNSDNGSQRKELAIFPYSSQTVMYEQKAKDIEGIIAANWCTPKPLRKKRYINTTASIVWLIINSVHAALKGNSRKKMLSG
jgi:hypothetical protein